MPLVAAAIAAGIAGVLPLVLLTLIPGTGVVVVLLPGFVYHTPPTSFCPFTATMDEGTPPPLVIYVRTDSQFNVSWQLTCEPYGPGNATGGEYAIDSVRSSTYGFTVDSSNVPVLFGYDRVGTFNVTVRAPSWPSESRLTLTVSGGPEGAP